MFKFRLYWKDGSTQVIEGTSIADAFMREGYGGGAMNALDCWHQGDDIRYRYIVGKWSSDSTTDTDS